MPLCLRRCALPVVVLLVLLGSAACGDAARTEERLRQPSVDSSDTRAHRLTRLVRRSDTLTILTRALREAELMQELQQQGPFTLFAPTDRAFQRYMPGFDTLLAPAGPSTVAPSAQQPARAQQPAGARPRSRPSDAPSPNRDTLRTLLQFHLVRGAFAGQNVADSLRLATQLAGESLALERGRRDRNRLHVQVDGMTQAVPIRRTLRAQNGVMHVIERPLRIPPPDTSVEGALSDTTGTPATGSPSN